MIAEIRDRMRRFYEETGQNPVKIVVSSEIYDQIELEFEANCSELMCRRRIAEGLSIDGALVRWSPDETGVRLES